MSAPARTADGDGIRITVLVEDCAPDGALQAEHGWAAWIEVGPHRVLFDTGQGRALVPNAERLGVSLADADAIVLSHGHYDHTGGLAGALACAARPRVYVHRAAFAPKYTRDPDGRAREIGAGAAPLVAVQRRADPVWVEGPTRVCERVQVTGPVPRRTGFEDTGGAFFSDAACRTPDPLTDDQALFMCTGLGTVVVLGCAHAGVVNTLRYIRELTENRPVHTVIGGLHLLHAGAERMQRTMAELHRLDIQRLLPCHCTGARAVRRIGDEFPGRWQPCTVGTAVEWR